METVKPFTSKDADNAFENYYMPSNWTSRHSSKEALIQHFVTVLTDNKNYVDENATGRFELDVCYLDDDDDDINKKSEAARFDFMYPEGITPSLLNGLPIHIYIHGGYWEEGDRQFYRGFAKPYLHRNDVIVAIMGYDLCSDRHKIPDVEQQCIQGFKYLSKKFPESTWVVYGHSAGGYLATTLLSYPAIIASHLTALVLLCGVYDLGDLAAHTHIRKAIDMSCVAQKQNLLTRCFSSDEAMSLLKERLKIVMLIGGDESPVFHCQSLAMFGKLSRDSFNVIFHIMKDEDHFSLVEGLCDQGSEVTRCISELLDTFISTDS